MIALLHTIRYLYVTNMLSISHIVSNINDVNDCECDDDDEYLGTMLTSNTSYNLPVTF